MAKRKDAVPMASQAEWVYYPQAEVYSWSGLLDQAIQLGIADLAAEGYAPVKLESLTQLVALKGQFARLIPVGGADSLQYWALRSAIEQVERLPVILAFHTASKPEVSDAPVAVLQAVPSPETGECALIWQRNAWRLIDKDGLGPDGIALQLRLRTALVDMAAPAAEWWTEEDARAVVGTANAEGSALNAHLADLAEQRKRRKSSPARWEAQWQTVRMLARQLAELYWIASQGTARAAIVNTSTPAVTVPADTMTQQIMRSLLAGKEYTADPEQHTAIWQPPFGEQNVTIQLSQQDGETWSQMMTILGQLGDEAQDVFCAVLAMALATNGSAALSQPFYLGPDDVLAFLGRHESNRAYTLEQRADTIQRLNVLTRVHVSAVLPMKRRNRVLRLNSPIVDLHGSTIGEYATDSGEILWQKRLVSLGNWAAIAPQLSSKTVLMLRKVLSYHPQKDRFAKRLGRYLTLHFTTGEVIEVQMGLLIKQAGIPVDRNNAIRTRQIIEASLAELVKDGILGGAALLVEDTSPWREQQKRIDQCTRGWWDDYEQQRWQLTPPSEIGGLLDERSETS